jgi:molecular chaperone IbpA
MTNVNINHATRHLIGFGQLLDYLQSPMVSSHTNYPPYNIIELDDNEYELEMAVAGFTQDQITVEEENSILRVSGFIEEEDDRNFVHRGIAGREFRREWRLIEHAHVQDASLANGVLTIRIKRELPEALKPRQIAVKG